MNGEYVYAADVTSLVDDLDVAGSTTAQDVAMQVVASMGEEVASLARQYAPKDTGELAASISHYAGPLRSSVRASAPHAAFVEFGTWSYNTIAPQTGTYTIEAKKGKALRFTGTGGRTVYRRKVEHPGIPAQPFLGRAAAEVVEKFSEGIGDVGVVLLLGGTA